MPALLVFTFFTKHFSYIDFVLDFSWSFNKKTQKKYFMVFQCPDCDTMFSSYTDFVLDISWRFTKTQEEILYAFQWQDCDATFSLYIDFVPDLSWRISKNTGRNLKQHFNVKKWYNVFFLYWFYSWLFINQKASTK